MIVNGKRVEFSVAPASKWQEYERRKREYVRKNGWTSDVEYRAAMEKICRELGI
uniref:Uncharacterized protein n=4 Tax=unclassified bacterial viruses TaxID=12333 RepID=A0AAU6W2V6_9VIRU